jgi:outer membrane receptor for ferrienterochelin and colicin
VLNVEFSEAQNIKGIILNNTTGKPETGIKIVLKQKKITSISDSQGQFGFQFADSVGNPEFEIEGREIVKTENTKTDYYRIFLTDNMEDLFDMSLEDLMKVEVHVASGSKSLTQREAPGIVSIITEEEIQNSGSRDLIDVLRLVPGISFGSDVQGVVGITMRGNWGHEGKVLLMIDGQEMNDLLYSCTFFGNHYSVDQIKKIEIIRGPGSSIYGGYAELGVINIITKSGKDFDGINAGGILGYLSDTFGRTDAHLEIGKKINNLEFSATGFLGQGIRSERNCSDIYGNSYSMKNESALDPEFLNFGFKYKSLSARFLYDNYHTTTRYWFGINLLKAYDLDFTTLSGELKYDFKINPKLILTPKINFIQNQPWKSIEEPVVGEDSSYFVYHQKALRIKTNLSASYDISEKINLIFGGEYFRDYVQNLVVGNTYWNGTDKVSLHNISGFAQGIFKTDFANITIGARAENHNIFGTSFAPRLGITKIIGNFHTKILLSQAFRSPGIENINLSSSFSSDGSPTIKPEKTQTAELELGYMITKKMTLTANVFYIEIDHPIVYIIDSSGNEGYFNKDKSGTAGFELEYRWRGEKSYATVNYSYYNARGVNKTDDYSVPGNENALLGTPQNRITFNGSLKLFKGLSINPTIIYMGKRYGYTSYDSIAGKPIIKEFNPIVLTNIFLNYRDFLTKRLNLGIGVYDIFNSDLAFIQPYNGGHAPLPSQGREIILKLSYGLNF